MNYHPPGLNKQGSYPIQAEFSDMVGALDAAGIGFIITDVKKPGNPVLFANDAAQNITGHSLEELIGGNLACLHGPKTDRAVIAQINAAVGRGEQISCEILNYRKSGETFWNEMTAKPMLDANGNVALYLALLKDVSGRHQEARLRSNLEARWDALLEHLPGYITQRIVKPDGSSKVIYVSPSFERLIGYNLQNIDFEKDNLSFVHPEDRFHVSNALKNAISLHNQIDIEFRLVHKSGSIIWIKHHSTPRILADGSVVWYGVGINITAECELRTSLQYLALTDPLTGLENRQLHKQRLEGMVTRHTVKSPSLIYYSIDLDGLQEINELYGTNAGDMVLHEIAERLKGYAGAEAHAARTGGDEFALAAYVADQDLSPMDKALVLRALLSEPITIYGKELSIESSIGVAVWKADEKLPASSRSVADCLINRANQALIYAKRQRQGSCCVHSAELNNREHGRIELLNLLKTGIKRQEFVLYYQPQVLLETGQIIGAEALIRWPHPTQGLKRPDEFIPLAESSGLIVPLGQWILETALREQMSWPKIGGIRPRLSVNVSGVQLKEPDFLDMVSRVILETGADPSSIDLELTETVLLDFGTEMRTKLLTLKNMGFKLALDDFGTGYSSFHYIRDLPIDTVKIDQTFIRRMIIDSSDASIVRAILAVAKGLSLEVVAEGIEAQEHRQFLHHEGCSVGQGYLFSMPLTQEDFVWLLHNSACLPCHVDSVSEPAIVKT